MCLSGPKLEFPEEGEDEKKVETSETGKKGKKESQEAGQESSC